MESVAPVKEIGDCNVTMGPPQFRRRMSLWAEIAARSLKCTFVFYVGVSTVVTPEAADGLPRKRPFTYTEQGLPHNKTCLSVIAAQASCLRCSLGT